MKEKSPEAAASFPDNFFDFVFLDARHDYVSALTDMVAFWPKLKPSGILAGHDFRDYVEAPKGTSNDWVVLPDGSRQVMFQRTAVYFYCYCYYYYYFFYYY
jgi:hypothetical protein